MATRQEDSFITNFDYVARYWCISYRPTTWPWKRKKDIVVQISQYNSKVLCYLHLSAFITVMKNDPDLSTISQSLIPQIVQTLFVATGCDYISFFSGVGKATFMRYFYQYAEFISSGNERTPGTPADTGLGITELNEGFLAFLRQVGTAYFKKDATGFATQSPTTSSTSTTILQPPLWTTLCMARRYPAKYMGPHTVWERNECRCVVPPLETCVLGDRHVAPVKQKRHGTNACSTVWMVSWRRFTHHGLGQQGECRRSSSACCCSAQGMYV